MLACRAHGSLCGRLFATGTRKSSRQKAERLVGAAPDLMATARHVVVSQGPAQVGISCQPFCSMHFLTALSFSDANGPDRS